MSASKTRNDLDVELAQLREWGVKDLILIGCALEPWHVQWALDAGVDYRQDPAARPGVLHLISRSALAHSQYFGLESS